MRLNVEGMTCSHCERAIEQAVASLGGIARIDMKTSTVEVEGAGDATAVRQAIEAAGYTVTDKAADFTSGCGCNH